MFQPVVVYSATVVFQPVVVYNGTVLSLPLLVQLVDEAGNPTAEANVRVQLTRDAGIKASPYSVLPVSFM